MSEQSRTAPAHRLTCIDFVFAIFIRSSFSFVVHRGRKRTARTIRQVACIPASRFICSDHPANFAFDWSRASAAECLHNSEARAPASAAPLAERLLLSPQYKGTNRILLQTLGGKMLVRRPRAGRRASLMGVAQPPAQCGGGPTDRSSRFQFARAGTNHRDQGRRGGQEWSTAPS